MVSQTCLQMSHESKAQSAYALHILKIVHEYGPINNKSLLKQVHKGPLMTSLQNFYIH